MSHPPSDTTLVHLGRNLGHATSEYGAVVNPPVCRGSTILFPSMDALWEAEKTWHDKPTYGRHGTAPVRAFEDDMAMLEGGYRAIAVSSGLAALTTALSAYVQTGDEVLVMDSVYSPTRKFCDFFLKRFGVTTRYYTPAQAGDIARLFQQNTKVLYIESPGSMTFEMADIPAMTEAARKAGIKVLVDNTWATPLGFRPFDYGVNVSIHAATKYILGHSDALLGVIVSDEASFMPLKKTNALLGQHASPDDVYLAHRGLRTMGVRLRQHAATVQQLSDWLLTRPEVARVLNPAHPSDPGHALWKKYYRGGCGLFSFVLKPEYTLEHSKRLVDSLQYFGIGYSWGGFESLALVADLQGIRSAAPWIDGQVIRLHAGLEDADDLQSDLEQAFEAMQRMS